LKKELMKHKFEKYNNILMFIITTTVLINSMLNKRQFHELSMNVNLSVTPMHYDIMLSLNIEIYDLDKIKTINDYENISFKGDSNNH